MQVFVIFIQCIIGFSLFVFVLEHILSKNWKANIEKYLKAKSKDFNRDKEMLYEYCKIVENNGYALEFRKSIKLKEHMLDAYAGFDKRNNSKILVCLKWVNCLIFQNSLDTKNAFMITLGHELTHKEPEIKAFLHPFHFKFYTWVKEVHADFSAAQKMAYSSRTALLNSIKYKSDRNGVGEEDCTHPN